jgi:hypothetical protein
LRFDEAHVKVTDPNDVQSVFAASVSVSRGDNVGTAALASQVAVQYGVSGDSQSALSNPIAVQYGNSAESGAALSQSVSVQRGSSEQTVALTDPVSVQYENIWGQYSALDMVSATTGPHVQSITPNSLTRGASVTVTINGVGLSGATALRFLAASGTLDSNITASNITINADGTSLTATINVSGSAVPGSHVVVVTTPNGDSMLVDIGTNTINVVQ